MCQAGEDDGDEIRCHRAVLAATSPYFRAMFTGGLAESRQDSVRLLGLDSGALSALVRYAYTGRLRVTRTNAQALLQAASLMQLQAVRLACAQFMQAQLHVQNCVAIYFFATLHECDGLASRAREFLEKHFVDVSQCEEFLQLPAESVAQLLGSSELNVEKEELVSAEYTHR